MGWMIGVLGFDSWRGLGIFLFTTASRMALGPTQPPIQGVLGALSLGVKQLGHEVDHSPPSSAEVKECMELYLHSPNTPSWHGAQFKKKAQGQLYLYFILLCFIEFVISFMKHLQLTVTYSLCQVITILING
jgi:hypothetical protein